MHLSTSILPGQVVLFVCELMSMVRNTEAKLAGAERQQIESSKKLKLLFLQKVLLLTTVTTEEMYLLAVESILGDVNYEENLTGVYFAAFTKLLVSEKKCNLHDYSKTIGLQVPEFTNDQVQFLYELYNLMGQYIDITTKLASIPYPSENLPDMGAARALYNSSVLKAFTLADINFKSQCVALRLQHFGEFTNQPEEIA